MLKIITHKGGAHRDEFLACSMLLAIYPSLNQIVRRDPTTAEIDSHDVFKVDVGMRLDKATRNYDHHQDLASPAAFVLVAKHELGWDIELAKAIFPWFQLSSDLDTLGPNKAAALHGMTTEGLLAALSPLEGAMLEGFAYAEGRPVEDVSQECISQMRSLGRRLVNQYHDVGKRLERLEKEACFPTVAGVTGIYHSFADRPALSMDLFHREQELLRGTIHFSITPDDRGEGLTLYRYNDSPKLNFAKLEGNPLVKFAHKGGFIAKTVQGVTKDQALDLIASALV